MSSRHTLLVPPVGRSLFLVRVGSPSPDSQSEIDADSLTSYRQTCYRPLRKLSALRVCTLQIRCLRI